EDAPIRLDFFGDTLESIRWFDAQSQRSEDTLDSVRVPPLSLFPAGSDEAELLAELLLESAGEEAGPEVAERIEELRRQGQFPGWDNYLPLLARETFALPQVMRQPLVWAVDPPALLAEVAHHTERLDG